jgi:hypothetical protein
VSREPRDLLVGDQRRSAGTVAEVIQHLGVRTMTVRNVYSLVTPFAEEPHADTPPYPIGVTGLGGYLPHVLNIVTMSTV